VNRLIKQWKNYYKTKERTLIEQRKNYYKTKEIHLQSKETPSSKQGKALFNMKGGSL
jgi:hypothetical protein